MKKNIITDTGFWIGLVDSSDQFHKSSSVIANLIKDSTVIIPWPCLYETITTRLARRRDQMLFFEEMISEPNIIFFDDDSYKRMALKRVFEFNKLNGFTFSLTDCVIREILNDYNVNIDFLITFNEKDFKDICDQRLIKILGE